MMIPRSLMCSFPAPLYPRYLYHACVATKNTLQRIFGCNGSTRIPYWYYNERMERVPRAAPILFAACALALLAMPPSSFAASVDYTRVVEHTESEVVIQRNSLSEEAWYRCTIQTLACNNVPKETSILPPGANATPLFMLAYRSLMPAGASSLLRSPDGKYIAFYIPATQSKKKRTFGVMDTTDLSVYTKEEVISYWDLLTEGVRYFVFSPDSKTLIYLDDVVDAATPYRVDLAALGSKGKELPAVKMFTKNYTVTDILFKDDATLWFIANRDNPYAWALYELNITTYNLKKIADNVSYAEPLRLKGEKLLFAQADERGVRPVLLSIATGAIERFSLPAWEAEETKGNVVTTLKGGLSGVFLLEKSGHSDTLLVWLHGGPYRQTAEEYHPYLSYGGYDWVLEKLRDADVGVLKLDYPGSAGFGRVFASSITGNIGVADAGKTAVAVADFAKRNLYKNVYLMGNSYGGYLALKMLVDAPSSYKGAFSINGVADWMTLLTRLDTSIFNVQFGGTVDETNRAMYQKASIYNYTDRLSNQKVVLIHGGADTSIPVSQSEGLATYLTAIDKNIQFIKLGGENHVYKKPESFETLCRAAFSLTNRTNDGACEL